MEEATEQKFSPKAGNFSSFFMKSTLRISTLRNDQLTVLLGKYYRIDIIMLLACWRRQNRPHYCTLPGTKMETGSKHPTPLGFGSKQFPTYKRYKKYRKYLPQIHYYCVSHPPSFPPLHIILSLTRSRTCVRAKRAKKGCGRACGQQ